MVSFMIFTASVWKLLDQPMYCAVSVKVSVLEPKYVVKRRNG